MLGKTVSELERDLGGYGELRGYAEFLSKWPAGEEAMDLRFQTLRKDLDDQFRRLAYYVQAANGCKNVKQPKFQPLKNFRIFRRLGIEEEPRGFANMTPEDINLRVKSVFGPAVAATKRRKRRGG